MRARVVRDLVLRFSRDVLLFLDVVSDFVKRLVPVRSQPRQDTRQNRRELLHNEMRVCMLCNVCEKEKKATPIRFGYDADYTSLVQVLEQDAQASLEQ